MTEEWLDQERSKDPLNLRVSELNLGVAGCGRVGLIPIAPNIAKTVQPERVEYAKISLGGFSVCGSGESRRLLPSLNLSENTDSPTARSFIKKKNEHGSHKLSTVSALGVPLVKRLVHPSPTSHQLNEYNSES